MWIGRIYAIYKFQFSEINIVLCAINWWNKLTSSLVNKVHSFPKRRVYIEDNHPDDHLFDVRQFKLQAVDVPAQFFKKISKDRLKIYILHILSKSILNKKILNKEFLGGN